MNFLLWENSEIKIEHCYTCAIEGYLIVSPKCSVDALFKLNLSTQEALGVALAKATKVVDEFLKPRKIYCASFGEEECKLHFHVFPRTDTITDKFLEFFSEQEPLIHGPVIMDWARDFYRARPEDVWLLIKDQFNGLRNKFYT